MSAATLFPPVPLPRVLGAMEQLPPFSTVLQKLMETLRDENVSYFQLASIIEADTVLAGNILRIVNSPLYGRRATVNSVKHAVALIGLTKVRNLALGLSVSKRWSTAHVPKHWSARQFNLHSTAVAILADLMAVGLEINYPEGAFAAGLLHDIGKLLLAVAAPAEYDAVAEECIRRQCLLKDIEEERIGLRHADLSRIVLEKWNLPTEIRHAVGRHHTALAGTSGLQLASVVEAADLHVSRLGFGMTPFTQPEGLPAPEDPYGLRARIETAREEFESELDAMRAVL